MIIISAHFESPTHIKPLIDDDHLGAKIHSISHFIHYKQDQLLEPYGITDRQARILIFLIHSGSGALFQKDIEDRFSRVSSSVTNMLVTLEKKGFITRLSDSSDARRKRILITEAGLNLEKIMFKSINEIEQNIKSILTEQEFETTKQALNKIIDSLSKENDK